MTVPAPDSGECLSFDRSRAGRRAVDVPAWAGEQAKLPPPGLLRRSLNLPEMSQGQLVRYYTGLAGRNYGVDSGSYPLGSCTMKYNPAVHEELAALPGFTDRHPFDPPEMSRGTLALLAALQESLAAITGLPAVSLAPAAGAQGELAGMLMIKKALAARHEGNRRRVLVPDSAHGTNPASAAMAGFTVAHVPTGRDGTMDPAALRELLGPDVAALMVTAPNTLGIWEAGVEEATRLVHEAGGLVYGDGANLNAIVGRLRFADLGFDVVHLNLHKTFSTPHGGGGPGAGPVCATAEMAPFLPAPVVETEPAGEGLRLGRPAESIGRLQQFHGSIAVLIRAYAYIRSLGLEGLRAVSESAVLNANYLRQLVRESYDIPYDRPVLHEVVLSGRRQKKENGVRTIDIAKRLIDYGIHPPTVYFPLIVEEALMIEPTETESREDVEALAEALIAIAEEAQNSPELLHEAPHGAPVGRLDEVTAARRPVLRWTSS